MLKEWTEARLIEGRKTLGEGRKRRKKAHQYEGKNTFE